MIRDRIQAPRLRRRAEAWYCRRGFCGGYTGRPELKGRQRRPAGGTFAAALFAATIPAVWAGPLHQVRRRALCDPGCRRLLPAGGAADRSAAEPVAGPAAGACRDLGGETWRRCPEQPD